MNVHSPFVRERTSTNEGLAGPEVHVGRLVDEARDLGQMRQLAGGKVVREPQRLARRDQVIVGAVEQEDGHRQLLHVVVRGDPDDR